MSKSDSLSSASDWSEIDRPGRSKRFVSVFLLVFGILMMAGFLLRDVGRSEVEHKTIFRVWSLNATPEGLPSIIPFSEVGVEKVAAKFGTQIEHVDLDALATTPITDTELQALDPTQDTVVVYLRGFARAYLVGGDQASDVKADILTGRGRGGRSSIYGVRVDAILERLLEIPTASILVIFDCSELDHEPALGVLANEFAAALSAELQKRADWDRIWVLNSCSSTQLSHVSKDEQQTLLAASLLDLKSESTNAKGFISLARLYEHVRQYCSLESHNQQTPLLMRGGVGIVKMTDKDASWKDASQILIGGFSDALPSASVASAATGGAAKAMELRLDTWKARDLLWSRQTPGGVSPADFSPGLWGEIQRYLVTMDQHARLTGKVDEQEWRDLAACFNFVSERTFEKPSVREGTLAFRLLEQHSTFSQTEAARQWKAVVSNDSDQANAILAKCSNAWRWYADATLQLPWWTELAGRLHDPKIASSAKKLAKSLDQYLDQLKSMRRMNTDEAAMQEPALAFVCAGDSDELLKLVDCGRSVELAIFGLIVDLDRIRDEVVGKKISKWQSHRMVMALLASPLIPMEFREELERGTWENQGEVLVSAGLEKSKAEPAERVSTATETLEITADLYARMLSIQPEGADFSNASAPAIIAWGSDYSERLDIIFRNPSRWNDAGDALERWHAAASTAPMLARLKPPHSSLERSRFYEVVLFENEAAILPIFRLVELDNRAEPFKSKQPTVNDATKASSKG